MDDFQLIQFVFLFGLSIVFSIIGLNRQTMISLLISGICWMVTGLTNFMAAPTEYFSMALSYILMTLGIIFMLASFKVLGESIIERKQARFKVSL